LTLADGQTSVLVARVGPGLFPLLGMTLAIGRGFLPGEGDDHDVVVISDGLWKRAFGSDPRILDRRLQLKDVSAAVVGVMPPGPAFPFADPPVEAWFPLGAVPDPGDSPFVGVVARLRPGLTPASAQPLLDEAATRIQKARPNRTPWGAELDTIDPRWWRAANNSMVLVAFGAVAFVLLSACANVANLLLARTSNREREFAVRRALGAGRIRLARQLLAESSLLALAGCAFAMCAALWLVRVIGSVLPPGAVLLSVHQMQVDWRVLAFALGVSLIVALASGVLPAVRGAGQAAPTLLTTTGRTMTRTREHRRTRDAFIAVQVAFAVVLLIGSGLLVTSFVRMVGLEPGYDVRNLLAVSVTLPEKDYSDLPRRQAFYDQLLETVRGVPGIEAATTGYPPASEGAGHLVPEGQEQHPESGGPAAILRAGPDYFRVLGIRLIEGREFSISDRAGGAPVCIIDEQAARRFWPAQTALGQRVRYSPLVPWITVVGVARNVKTSGAARAIDKFAVYLPQSQDTQLWATSLLVRSGRDARDVAAAVRARVRALEPRATMPFSGPVEELYARAWVVPRFGALIMSGFAALALLTAAAGLYAMLRYAVTQRTAEIGVRMALGARPAALIRLVFADAIRPVTVGVVGGLGIAAWLVRFVEASLYHVSPYDPLTLLVVATVFAAVAAAAVYGPVRRAIRIDPIVALRAE